MSSPLAFVFPGQGSQFVGMGRSLFDCEPTARARFEEADAVLGRSLSSMCFEGPEDDLKSTENTQPALFVCSVVACDVLRERGVLPACVAGHSLGEYSALYAAGVFDFATGVRLIAARGRAMAEAGRATSGTMAAIMGLDIDKLEAICAEATTVEDGVVIVANDNSPGQTVISGTLKSVTKACELAKTAGAKRALPLAVSGAFHSPLVEPARKVMAEMLESAKLNPPACGFIPNVTARPEQDPEAIRRYLIEQITSRVRWVESVRAIAAMGITTALEVGPGKVLAGLIKRIEKDLNVFAAGTAEEIASAVESIT